MSATRGMSRIVCDMDEHGKMKNEVKMIIKESMDLLASKEFRVISAHIKRKCDEKYGPTWHCIVGDDFKASISHESKHFMFVTMGKCNVLLFKCG